MNQMKGFHRPFGGVKVFKDPKNMHLMRPEHKIEGGPAQQKPSVVPDTTRMKKDLSSRFNNGAGKKNVIGEHIINEGTAKLKGDV